MSKKVKPGLSSFSKTPLAAGASLQGLIEFMKEQVPEQEWARTPIWLKATAGLRLLDKDVSIAILKSVRSYLGNSYGQNSPFYFKPSHANIISGSEEGAFGWVAVNYLYRQIGPRRTHTATAAVAGSVASAPSLLFQPFAVVEMGGASSQVTQAAVTAHEIDSIDPRYRLSLTLEGTGEVVLYTHSYLGYGSEQAREAVNKHLLLTQHKSSASSKQLQTGGATAAVTATNDPCLNTGFAVDNGGGGGDVYNGPAGSVVGTASIATGTQTQQQGQGQQGQGQHVSCRQISEHVLFTSLEKKHSRDCLTFAARHQSFSFSCIHQPKFVQQSTNFLVFENFYYAASAASVHPAAPHHPLHVLSGRGGNYSASFPLVTTAGEFAEAAALVCGKSWVEMQQQYPLDHQPRDTVNRLCFSLSFADLFLSRGLGLDPQKKIKVQQEVGGSPIEWAIGAAYLEATKFVKTAGGSLSSSHLRSN